MKNEYVHQTENNSDSQSFLDENRGKFETDAQFLLRQMMRGERLTAQTVVQKYSCEPRRLRDLHNDGKCQKQWKLNEAGKRMYVEYFCPIPLSPTKQKAIEWATETLEAMKNGKLSQKKLF